jgi:hypothetical protein
MTNFDFTETEETLSDFTARYGKPTIAMGAVEVQHHWFGDTYVILAERQDGTRATAERQREDREPAWMRALH